MGHTWTGQNDVSQKMPSLHLGHEKAKFTENTSPNTRPSWEARVVKSPTLRAKEGGGAPFPCCDPSVPARPGSHSHSDVSSSVLGTCSHSPTGSQCPERRLCGCSFRRQKQSRLTPHLQQLGLRVVKSHLPSFSRHISALPLEPTVQIMASDVLPALSLQLTAGGAPGPHGLPARSPVLEGSGSGRASATAPSPSTEARPAWGMSLNIRCVTRGAAR